MVVNDIKLKLCELGVDRYVFKDKKGELSPINVCGIEIYGIYISPIGTVWLVDGRHIKQDEFNNMEFCQWGNKHLAASFNKNSLNKVIEMLR